MSLTKSKEMNNLSKRYSTQIERRITKTVMVGDVGIGSEHPVIKFISATTYSSSKYHQSRK